MLIKARLNFALFLIRLSRITKLHPGSTPLLSIVIKSLQKNTCNARNFSNVEFHLHYRRDYLRPWECPLLTLSGLFGHRHLMVVYPMRFLSYAFRLDSAPGKGRVGLGLLFRRRGVVVFRAFSAYDFSEIRSLGIARPDSPVSESETIVDSRFDVKSKELGPLSHGC